MSDKRDYSKEIEEIISDFRIWKINEDEFVKGVNDLFSKTLSEKEEESKQSAINFYEFYFKSGYRLNPHSKETRFLPIGSAYSDKPILTDGITISELYDIFSPPTNINKEKE